MFGSNTKIETYLVEQFLNYCRSYVKYETLNDSFWISDHTGIWQKDHQDTGLRNKLSQYQSMLSQEVPYELLKVKDTTTRKTMQSRYQLILKWLKQSENVNLLIKQIKNQQNIQFNDSTMYFNHDPDYILFKNHIVLNFRTGCFQRYVAPKNRIANNRMLLVNFKQINKQDIAAIDSLFNRLIKDTTQRQDFIDFLKNALFGLNKKRIMMNTGGNGKDIFMQIFLSICGTYCLSIEDTVLYNAEPNPSILRNLHQNRIVSFDVENLNKVKLNIMKALTCTHELIDHSIHFQEPEYFFFSQASIFFNCHDGLNEFINNLESDAVKNRIMITEFEHVDSGATVLSQQCNINLISYLLMKFERFDFV